jgi:catechol 2,3-dioxygenase-like lactoylglutathione lyase family enzyme
VLRVLADPDARSVRTVGIDVEVAVQVEVRAALDVGLATRAGPDPRYAAPSMIDHLSLGVSDLARAAAFYDAVLGTLGYVRLFTHARAIGYGRPGDRDEQLALLASPDRRGPPEAGFHLALVAASRDAIAAFHSVAIRSGGLDAGSPGLRPECGPGYYAAFVVDLDGYRLEAVLHEGMPCPPAG